MEDVSTVPDWLVVQHAMQHWYCSGACERQPRERRQRSGLPSRGNVHGRPSILGMRLIDITRHSSANYRSRTTRCTTASGSHSSAQDYDTLHLPQPQVLHDFPWA